MEPFESIVAELTPKPNQPTLHDLLAQAQDAVFEAQRQLNVILEALDKAGVNLAP